MLTRFTDLDRSLSVWGLRRHLDHVWDDFAPSEARQARRGLLSAVSPAIWPTIDAVDTGTTVVLRGDVPGMSEKDVTVTLTESDLTIAGERKAVVREGYSLQRQERPTARFSRSWKLPYKIDGEKTTATVKDGVLTVTLAKVREAEPRHIAVRAA